MIDFLNRLFGRQNSGATAKERLRLVLMSDHLSLAPEMIESMKRDLVDVISKYVEVDRDRIDVHFENQDKVLAMLANIPITGVNRNAGSNGNGTANGMPANGAPATNGNGSHQAESVSSTTEPTDDNAPASSMLALTKLSANDARTVGSSDIASGAKPRSRKRRKRSNAGAQRPANPPIS